MYHLAQVDLQVVTSLEKKLSSGKELKPLRWITRFRAFLLNLFLRLPLKFKAPPAVREVPDEVQILQVIQTWADTRKKLQGILSNLPGNQLQKEIFFHPRAGMLTLPQTLHFMKEHTSHHHRQLKRLLS